MRNNDIFTATYSLGSDPLRPAVSVTLAHEWHDYGKKKRPLPAYDRVLFSVDGHEYAWREISIDVEHPSTVVFYTPILAEGVHWLSVGCGHPEYRLTTAVAGMSVSRCLGLDLEDIARRRNRIRDENVVSRVSPAFVEGDARFPWRVASDAGTVRPSGVGSWYVDVPFGSNASVVVTLSFEDVATTNVVVEWEPTNPFVRNDPVLMRAGSKLMFSGTPDGSTNGVVRIETNGTFACGYSGDASVRLAFPEGEFEVVATWSGPEEELVRSETLHVSSVGGRFPSERPACLVGASRTWKCPELPGTCVVSGDARTTVGMTAAGTLNLSVSDTRGERMVTARISENGPVLDCRPVDPLWVVAAYGNIVYEVMTNEYGMLCRSVMSQQGASEGVRFRIQSYLSSILLDDLTTSRTVAPGSFDEAGHYTYDLYKPDSAKAPCHSVFVYQGAVKIGEAVYGNGPMPEEWR